MIPRLFSVLTRPLIPYTLLGRALTILITPMVLVQLIVGVVFWDRYWTKITEKLSDQLTAQIVSLIEVAPHKSLSDLQTFSLKHFNIESNIFRGNPRFNKNLLRKENWRENFLSAALRKKTSFPFRVKIIKNIVHIQIIDGPALYDFKFTKRQLFSKSMPKILWWEIGAPIVFLIIAIIFMKNQIKPLEKLADYVAAVGKGRNPMPLRPAGAYEVRALIRSFNEMQNRILRQINQRTEMLAGISHDLKTPLTRMELELAMMADNESRESLQQEVKEMEHMVEQYLAFARGEEGEAATSTNLDSFMTQLVAQYSSTRVHYQPMMALPDLIIRPGAMKRAFKNIVDNALRYGKHVWLTVQISKKSIKFYFEDDGPGIDKSRYDDVFRPFVRLDESRNMDTGGYGLGLSIVKDVINAHGGSVNLSHSRHRGLKVSVKLPR